jgi:hypothetical protein
LLLLCTDRFCVPQSLTVFHKIYSQLCVVVLPLKKTQ